jgi:hypothetical protein
MRGIESARIQSTSLRTRILIEATRRIFSLFPPIESCICFSYFILVLFLLLLLYYIALLV